MIDAILNDVSAHPAFGIFATAVITAGLIGIFVLALAHRAVRQHRKQLKQRKR